jgi:hypothetical protein
MNEIIAKLFGLANFKTLTVVMFIILSILLTNNMIPNDNTIFYITSYTLIILFYVYNNPTNKFTNGHMKTK